MAKSKRVFEVAKELGVKSKVVVEKCQAEGIPNVTNHMSTVSLGLSETIKQWFSDAAAEVADDTTAVEESDRVDLSEARKATKAKAKAKAKAASHEGEGDTATAVEEAPPKKTAAKRAAARKRDEEQAAPAPQEQPVEAEADEQAKPESEQVEQPPAVAAEAEPPEKTEADEPKPAAEAEQPEASPAEDRKPVDQSIKIEGEVESKPAGTPNVPDRPQSITPVGPMLEKPQEAKLSGPKVVRVEKPDPVRAPRPRPRPRSAPQGPAEPGAPGPDTGDRGGGGGGGRGRGKGGETEQDASRSGKRRGFNVRRGRSADSFPGRSKFSEQDMLELDARLNRSSGFLKQRRREMKKREGGGGVADTPAAVGGKVEINEPFTIKEFSGATGIRGADVVKYLFNKGLFANINSFLDVEAATEVAMEYDIELIVKAKQTAEQQVEQEFEAREATDERCRPPVVTVLGHVDHGKTSLLDKIRKEDVAAHESGGITQHIGAYRVTIPGTDGEEKTVVFLDTPGHEAFTSMRSRGANMTDLVVLVIAADDGVMPQTLESINHAQAAGVPIIIALNKTDLPAATTENIQKIYGQLAEHNLNPVEWGGETEVVKTSAETGEGISDLLEVLDFQAELLELTASYGGTARGTVIEAEMQEGRGPVMRVLVQEGHLKVGNFIVAGRAFGRVRDMTDDRNRTVDEVGPATPVELSGIDQVPDAGDKFYVTDTLQRAEEVAQQYRDAEREEQLATQNKVTLQNFSETLQAGQIRELRVVVKADVQGSVDVLEKSLGELGNDEVRVRVLHSGVGGINESDVLLADASDAIIFGFHVVAPAPVRDIAEQRNVEVRIYHVIYELLDDVKKGLEGMLTPEVREEAVGEAEVLEAFRITKLGMVAGCMITEGVVRRGVRARVIRDDVVVAEDREVVSVRRVKDDVREVRAGTECGVRMSNFDDLKAGDKLAFYEKVEVSRTL